MFFRNVSIFQSPRDISGWDFIRWMGFLTNNTSGLDRPVSNHDTLFFSKWKFTENIFLNWQ